MKKNAIFIKLQCSECKNYNYRKRKNKKKIQKKLEFKKFCKHCKKHTAHQEAK